MKKIKKTDYSKMSKKELEVFGRDYGLELDRRLKKSTFVRMIELAVEKEPHSSMMYNSVYDKVSGHGINCKIRPTVIKQNPELDIYKNFRFSTLHLSKKDMLNIAKNNHFDNILKLTWSCWYPINGKPCKRIE